MIEEFIWVLVFLLCLAWTHYQFKYCVPVGLGCLKVLHASLMLLIIRLYILIRIENYTIDWTAIRKDMKTMFEEL